MSLSEQEKLGVTLFHKRKELSLLQGEVALMVGVEKPTISAYECGVVKNISLRTRVKLAQALDLSLEEILYDSKKDCLKLRRLKEE